MTFLNPFLLLGLAAAAIPLIIHLFNFRRPRRVNFSSLAFLHELKKSTMQRVRIKQWLLLALRTLAIAALVLAFARPTLTGPLAGRLGGSGRTTTALVLDNSTSMTLRDGSGAYLEQGQTIVGSFLSEFESGDEVLLATTPASSERAVFHQNMASAQAALDDVATVSGNEKLTAAISRAGERLADRPTINRDVFVISDFQRSMLSDSARIDLPEGTRVLLVPVGTDGRGNLAVSDVQVRSQIISEGQPVQFEATITNYGSDDIRGVVASLFLDGQRIGQATVDVQAGARASARFVAAPRSRGWLSGHVEIDDNQYLFDNRRPFALHVPQERKLLMISGLQAQSSYLSLGISSDLARSGARFVTDEILETTLASTSLGSYDAVILNGVETLSSGERASLEQYVRNGGGLLVFAGEDMQAADYNAFFEAIGAGRLQRVEGEPGDAVIGTFSRVDVDHPLFEGMFEPGVDGRIPQLEQPVIFRSAIYDPGAGNEQTIIGMSSGAPFLQEMRVDQGSVLFYSVEAGASWSDMPVRGLFIPLLYRSLYYLSATGSVSGEEMIAGGSLQLLLPDVSSGTTITVHDESGLEFIPDQRDVFGGVVLNLSGSFFLPGLYDLMDQDRMVRRIAVQAPSAESDLALERPEAVREHFASLTDAEVGIMDVALSGAVPLEEQLRAARTGVELWNVFLGLALLFLVLEMVVSKHFRPEAAN